MIIVADVLVCAGDALAQQFMKLATKSCMDRLSELRRSFLTGFTKDVQEMVAAIIDREKESWGDYIFTVEREARCTVESNTSILAGSIRRMSQRSVAFSDTVGSSNGVGSGVRKASIISSRGDSFRRMSSAPVTPATVVPSLPADVVPTPPAAFTIPASPVTTSRRASALSPTRRQSVAPLGPSFQAWSAPVDVGDISPTSSPIGKRNKLIASGESDISTETIRAAMAPCDKKTQLINILSSAMLRDITLLVENIIQGCVLELQLILYEMAMVEQMESYMIHELALMESRLDKRRDIKLNDLHLRHLKEKSTSLSERWDADALCALEASQTAQVVKLQGKFQERLRHKKAKFQESRLRTGDVLMSKLAALRRRFKNSPLSDTGLEKLKNVCLVYQTLREAEE